MKNRKEEIVLSYALQLIQLQASKYSYVPIKDVVKEIKEAIKEARK